MRKIELRSINCVLGRAGRHLDATSLGSFLSQHVPNSTCGPLGRGVMINPDNATKSPRKKFYLFLTRVELRRFSDSRDIHCSTILIIRMSARRAASAAWRGLVQGMKPTTASFGSSATMAGRSSIPRAGISVASLLFAGVPKLTVPPSPPPPSFASSAISTSAVTAAPGGSAPGGGGSGGGLPASEEESGDADPPHLKTSRKTPHVTNKADDYDSSGSAEPIRKMRETAAAQAVMEDPMSMLLASRGMPLGISSSSLGSRARSLSKEGKGGKDDDSDNERPDMKKEAQFDMEALKEIFDNTAPSATAMERSDSWGTTKKGAEEIARHLVESNRGEGGILS